MFLTFWPISKANSQWCWDTDDWKRRSHMGEWPRCSCIPTWVTAPNCTILAVEDLLKFDPSLLSLAAFVDEATLGRAELEGPQEVGDLKTGQLWCKKTYIYIYIYIYVYIYYIYIYSYYISISLVIQIRLPPVQIQYLLEVWAHGVDLVDDILHSMDAMPRCI